MMQQVIARLIAGENLNRAESRQVIDNIMEGNASDAQIAAILTALRIKGETVEEISGAAEAMAGKAERFKIDTTHVVDTCGTGGDNLHTFNISTTAAFVAAGSGVRIAKHGNRSVSSHCGSADILKSFGVNIDLSIDKFIEVFNKVGLAFLFAPLYHKAMKYAIGPRREMGVRTIFNVLGPLTNPARVKRQVIGVYDKNLCRTMAEVMRELGSEHVMVVHGENGLDEISISGKTFVCELKEGKVSEYTISPADYGLPAHTIDKIQSDSCDKNKKIISDILDGQAGAPADVAILNAAASIYVSGIVASFKEGVDKARESIMSGAARERLDKLVQATNA